MNQLCSLLGVDLPLVLAPFGPWDQVRLAAAVSNAGGLGSVGTAVRSVTELQKQWGLLRDQTERPFAVNHTGRPFDRASFDATLDLQPVGNLLPHGHPSRPDPGGARAGDLVDPDGRGRRREPR